MKKLILLFVFIAFNSNAASMKMIGSKGDPKDVTRVIEVKMYDNYYEPSSIKVKKGETVKIIVKNLGELVHEYNICLLYTSPSPRDTPQSRMPSSA